MTEERRGDRESQYSGGLGSSSSMSGSDERGERLDAESAYGDEYVGVSDEEKGRGNTRGRKTMTWVRRSTLKERRKKRLRGPVSEWELAKRLTSEIPHRRMLTTTEAAWNRTNSPKKARNREMRDRTVKRHERNRRAEKT